MLLARPRLHVTWEWPSALAGDAEALLLVKFTVFCGLGTLCYAMCAMKPPILAIPGPWRGGLSGVPFWCSVLCNMHHEAFSSGPGEEASWHSFLVSVVFL